jgi:hypothetical protein
MKRKIIYIGIVLLAFAITTIQGQNTPAEPRRTADEQAAFEKTVKVNPAKIAPQTQVDSRPDATLAPAPPVNWKAAPAPEEVRQSPEIQITDKGQQTGSGSVSPNKSQPEPKQAGKTESRRDMQGTKDQPQGSKPADVKSRRDLNGPKTQPEAKKPE